MRKFFTPVFLLMTMVSFQAKAQLNVDLLGHLDYGVDQLSNLTGWSDGAGHEYAIVGTSDGTSIVDITDPTTPTEVQFVDGNNSIWREVRTWSHYAYVVTEAGGGLLCIDLSGLPGSVTYNFTDCGIGISSGHTVFCDENGIVHIFGSNIGAGGDQMVDANVDPMDPTFVGEVDTWYIHDGFVRGDTLWAANIYNGWFSVWDISDKTSPSLMAQQSTPGVFTHNTWLTDDNKYIFTTDEETDATVASYDVSDLTDIKELDQFQANPGTSSIPHNVMVRGDFLITAYYRDGVIITDAHYPDNMIKTGWYDTSPLSGDGFNGCWGSWPYLPSGNIIASDMEEGLFVLGPTYVAACYLEGLVTDATTGAPIFDATISFTAPGATDASSDLTGNYHSGVFDPATYDITFTKPGYLPKVITGVALASGVVTTVDAELTPLTPITVTGQILDAVSGMGIANADVLFENALYSFHVMTDASGNYSIPGMYEDTYNMYAGHWGHQTNGNSVEVVTGGSYTMVLNPGYYDDFIFDNNWTVAGTAAVGVWERGDPNGTMSGPDESNPEDDADDDYGSQAYVTGNAATGTVGTDDVDNGTAILISPDFDMTGYSDPILHYDRWFYNGGGTGTPNDTLRIFVNNGTTEALIDAVNSNATDMSEWVPTEIHIADYVSLSSTMHIRLRTADLSASGHLVEAGLDKFYVYDAVSSSPTTAFAADKTSGCAPLTVVFDDMSTGATGWEWTFPGGTPATSNLENPSVVYNTPGTYDVTLVTSNMAGSTTLTNSSYVTAELCNAIEDVDAENNFAVSPNPFNAAAVVTVKIPSGADRMVITDVTGKMIQTVDMTGKTTMTIDGKSMPAGIYFVRLYHNGTEIGSVKLIRAS